MTQSQNNPATIPTHDEPRVTPDAGSPNDVIRVAIAQSEITAHLLADLLHTRNIPAFVHGEWLAPIVGAGSAQAAVYVRRDDHPLATSILTELSLGGDPRVNTCHECGYPLDNLANPDPCPECGAHTDTRAYDKQGHCVACRYDLAGLEDAEYCPECGLNLKTLGAARTRFHLVPAPGRPPLPLRIIPFIGWLILIALAAILLTLAAVGIAALIRFLNP